MILLGFAASLVGGVTFFFGAWATVLLTHAGHSTVAWIFVVSGIVSLFGSAMMFFRRRLSFLYDLTGAVLMMWPLLVAISVCLGIL